MKCKAVKIEIDEREALLHLTAETNEHLLVCAECRLYLDEHQSLLKLVGSLDAVEAPPDFDWRLRARLAEARVSSSCNEPQRSSLWSIGFAPGPQAIALAASFALLLVGLLVFPQLKASPESSAKYSAVARLEESAEVEVQANQSGNPNEKAQASAPAKDGLEASGIGQSARPRGPQSSRSGVKGTEIASGAPATQQRIYSNDFGSRAAQAIATEELQNSLASAGGVGPVITVPLRTSNPATLRFEDEQGTKRSLSPVNFGGQELMGRTDAARLVPASEKGIW